MKRKIEREREGGGENEIGRLLSEDISFRGVAR